MKEKIKAFFKAKAVKLAAFASVASASLIPLASAAEGDPVANGLDTVVASTGTITSLMTAVWNMMTSNPLLTLFLGVSLLGVGIATFKKIRGATGGGRG